MPYPDNFNQAEFDAHMGVGFLDPAEHPPPRPPTHDDLLRLWGTVMSFIDNHKLDAPSDIFLSDEALDDAARLVESACGIVGCHPEGCA